MTEEVWRPIPGHNYYEASSLGRIRSTDRVVPKLNRWGVVTPHRFKSKVLTPWLDGNGYEAVYVTDRRAVNVHRLVASAFLGAREGNFDVNHRDGDKANNSAENLEWCTRSENMHHAYRNGLFRTKRSRMLEAA